MEHPIIPVMQVAGAMQRTEIRSAILTLEAGLKAAGGFGREGFPIEHTFVGNNYARQMALFAGDTVVGGIHKHSHLNFIMCGSVRVLTEQEGFVEYTGPCMFVSPAGTKRVVHVIEDTIWIAVHEVKSNDLDEIEAEVLAESYDDIELVAEFKEVV